MYNKLQYIYNVFLLNTYLIKKHESVSKFRNYSSKIFLSACGKQSTIHISNQHENIVFMTLQVSNFINFYS